MAPSDSRCPEDLARRIGRLERESRTWRSRALLLTVALISLVVSGQVEKRETPGELRGHTLGLVDSHNRERAALMALFRSGALSLVSDSGRRGAELASSGHAALDLRDGCSDAPGLELRDLGDEVPAGLVLFDSRGWMRATVGMQEGEPAVAFYDRHRKLAWEGAK